MIREKAKKRALEDVRRNPTYSIVGYFCGVLIFVIFMLDTQVTKLAPAKINYNTCVLLCTLHTSAMVILTLFNKSRTV